MTKKVAKKSTSKKTVSKKAAPKKTAAKSKKKATKAAAKKTTKKKVAKKAASKKTTTKKPAAKKKPATKAASKKSTKKVTKKITKKTTKKTSKKAAKKTAKKAPNTKAATSKSEAKPAAKTDPKAEAAKPKEGENKAPAKKFRSRNRKKNPIDYAPPTRPLLLGPGSKLSGGPLITSSKRTKASNEPAKVSKRTKTPFTAKQLDDYKLTLLKKRSELVGDIENLEEEALRSSSGETQTASNAAEFGSESFEQSLNLDLAAADRKLINEIDEALQRIADRTYGLCIESHEPISKARLAELPWAKFSIETARKHDQRFTR